MTGGEGAVFIEHLKTSSAVHGLQGPPAFRAGQRDFLASVR